MCTGTFSLDNYRLHGLINRLDCCFGISMHLSYSIHFSEKREAFNGPVANNNGK